MKLVPITVKAALREVRAKHRHLPDLQGGLFAVGVETGGELVGVGVAGNPSRVWQATGRLVISRCALMDELEGVIDSNGKEHAAPGCSMVYGALSRDAKALGYHEVWTYTLPEEDGRSLKAAGFVDMGLTSGGEHCRPSRYRAPAKHPEPKRRWLRKLAA